VKILTPESMERAMAEISLVLSGQTIPISVYSLIARDGTVKHGEISGAPILRNGDIVGMVSVVRDITERKQAEEKIRQSEKKYHELFDFLPIPVYEMDFEANIISANRSIYETFGGSEEDLKKGLNAWQLLSPEEINKSSKNIERLLKGEQVWGTEYILKRLDGSLFPGIVFSSVIYSNDKPVGLRGAIVDITKRKQQEEELLRTNILLNSIVENIPDMIFLKDARELQFIRFNRAGEDLLGQTGITFWERTIMISSRRSRRTSLPRKTGRFCPGRRLWISRKNWFRLATRESASCTPRKSRS
jgi:PAS domain S-box-containing protein